MSAHGNGDLLGVRQTHRRLGDVTWRRFVTSLWWPAKARRWRKGFLLGVALTVLIVGLTVLAISGRADRACSGRNIGCGVVVNFVITSGLAPDPPGPA
jgi:hypothetical protein